MTNPEKLAAFAALHVPGAPLILFNVWDAGSAAAAERAGARAIATGSWSVAAAQGFHDAEALPMPLALDNARRIVAATTLPVSIDFEGCYATDADGSAANMAALEATGAIGCNFEDQVIGASARALHPLKHQAARIAAARAAIGADFFINARTDIFLVNPAASHDATMADGAIERARAYAGAGANGFFVPGLIDLGLLERVCAGSPLPVNFMASSGAPGAADVAATGIARISHGPGPYRLAMAAFETAAKAAFAPA